MATHCTSSKCSSEKIRSCPYKHTFILCPNVDRDCNGNDGNCDYAHDESSSLCTENLNGRSCRNVHCPHIHDCIDEDLGFPCYDYTSFETPTGLCSFNHAVERKDIICPLLENGETCYYASCRYSHDALVEANVYCKYGKTCSQKESCPYKHGNPPPKKKAKKARKTKKAEKTEDVTCSYGGAFAALGDLE